MGRGGEERPTANLSDIVEASRESSERLGADRAATAEEHGARFGLLAAAVHALPEHRLDQLPRCLRRLALRSGERRGEETMTMYTVIIMLYTVRTYTCTHMYVCIILYIHVYLVAIKFSVLHEEPPLKIQKIPFLQVPILAKSPSVAKISTRYIIVPIR